MDSSDTPANHVTDYEISESVGHLLARVKSTMSNMITHRALDELGITNQQGSVLLLVARGRCVLAAQLAREYGIDAAAVTRLIDRLEKRGLLNRTRSYEDRRALHLSLTPKGHAIAARMAVIFTEVLGELFRGFTAEEIAFLKSLLCRVLFNSGNYVA
jgi:DNA-binding MarR family transcriptional regulator